jgi:hypothetical protein
MRKRAVREGGRMAAVGGIRERRSRRGCRGREGGLGLFVWMLW